MRVCNNLLCIALFAWIWVPEARSATVLIRNITVVDVRTGSETGGQSILIRNDRILSVGSQIALPKGAAMINGQGKFAIPGLWDMHVHLWYRDNQFPLFLANGVTGVRDMGSDLNWTNQWRDQMRAGKLLGPHIETCGPPVDGFPSSDTKLPVLVVHAPEEARNTFDRLEDLDVDFVKVLSGLPRDAYFALAERARKYYKPVAGHLPLSVSLMEAIDARQKSVEHMSGVLLGCSRREDLLRNRLILANEKHDGHASTDLQAEILRTFDQEKATDLFLRMAQFEMREVPTLSMLKRSMYVDSGKLSSDPSLRYIPASIRKGWNDPLEDRKKLSEENLTEAADEYRKLGSLIPQMRKAGVMILAGTDTGDPYTFPGFELHRELELLVEAGLSPLEALRSATIEPAKYFGAEENIGSIDSGKVADLVLLDADPLKDIANTRKISAVILGGKYLSKHYLDGMVGPAKKP